MLSHRQGYLLEVKEGYEPVPQRKYTRKNAFPDVKCRVFFTLSNGEYPRVDLTIDNKRWDFKGDLSGFPADITENIGVNIEVNE